MAERERRRTPTVTEYSSLRWAVNLPVQLVEHGSCPLPVRIADLSMTGCRISAGYRVTPDRPARLIVPGLAPIRGWIAWARDWQCAVRFDTRLHPSVLQHLVSVGRVDQVQDMGRVFARPPETNQRRAAVPG